MADGSAASLSGVGEHRWELRKEALTMALYVAICLMASLIVIPETAVGHTKVLGLIWAAQLLGAGGVALLVSLGVLVLPDSVELEGAEFLLAALISLIGFAVARGAGASLLRAVVYALFVLAGAVTSALLKNLLAGH